MRNLLEALRLLNKPCRDMSALLSRSLDERLPRSQRWAVRLHVCYCRYCARYLRHLRLLRGAVRRLARQLQAEGPLPPGPQMSESARQRILRTLS